MTKKDAAEKKELDDYGIIFVSGDIDQGTAQSVCEKIIEINVAQNCDFIQLIMNSQGGLCAAGFAIIDMMDWSRLPVYTTGVGIIASMALGIFMAGEKGHRVLTPRTSILSHRFSGFSYGNHSELIAKRKEEDLMHRRLLDHYIQHTALKTDEEVMEKLLRDVDTWLTPQEALKMGIADKIQQDQKTFNPAQPGGREKWEPYTLWKPHQ
jgi:ATP-dependent Clp protease protease subunit